MLKQFLDSYRKSLPQAYNKLIKKLQSHPTLVIHHPIIAIPSAHPLTIKIKTPENSQPILPGVSILMLSASQSFTNLQLIGATQKDKQQVETFFNQNAQKYDILNNEDLRGLFKILIQIYANEAEIAQGEMPLHYYANLLINQTYASESQSDNKSNVLTNLGLDFDLQKYSSKIKSFHLLNILKSNENIVKKLYQILCSEFIKVSNEKQFSNLIRLVRASIRQVSQLSSLVKSHEETDEDKKIMALSPILPSLTQSFTPNCVLVGKYFTHLRQSYFSLQTLRQINPGEELTIPMKRGINNYDKLIRFGYKSLLDSPQNPDNFYPLIINLMDPSIQQVQQIIMSGDVDEKMRLLNIYDLKMKNIIRIEKNGQIKKQDMKMMRILYGINKEKDIEGDQSLADKKIYQFVGKFVEKSLEKHRNQSTGKQSKKQSEDPILKSFKIIEADEINILEAFTNNKRHK